MNSQNSKRKNTNCEEFGLGKNNFTQKPGENLQFGFGLEKSGNTMCRSHTKAQISMSLLFITGCGSVCNQHQTSG